mmetsp:Transcript_35563/g.52122  ORF Transcript_35563/g.52122 Transcript_35563/m.52122 type:complete len:451 (+) Transcript_35563:215-1567(+)
MGDAASLRSTLLSTNNTAQSIQNSASTMMRLYDRSASLAVSEWRNSLQTCSTQNLLPLLYVANEVLQTSKRNRGNKFLEAFSPVLKSSLQFICERDKKIVEKVRRTAKIWGDRRVFSVRFVGELLTGLDMFRSGSTPPPAAAPQVKAPNRAAAAPKMSDAASTSSSSSDSSSPFLGDRSNSLLDITVKIDKSALHAAEAKKAITKQTKKRRRTSLSSTTSEDGTAPPNSKGGTSQTSTPLSTTPTLSTEMRKPKKYTTDTLLSLLQHTSTLSQTYNTSLATLSSIPPSHLQLDETAIDELVGNELLTTHEEVLADLSTLKTTRATLLETAQAQYELEKEVVRYLPWLKGGMKVDEDEVKFCNGLLEKLELLKVIHADAKAVRDKKRDDEARQKALEEAEARRREEEEERKRSLEDAMKSKEMEAKPGMVWNKQLREYQYLHDHTEESWRD